MCGLVSGLDVRVGSVVFGVVNGSDVLFVLDHGRGWGLGSW